MPLGAATRSLSGKVSLVLTSKNESTKAPRCAHRRQRDSGQAVLLMLPVMAVAALLALGVAEVGHVVVLRARAQTAADAAALAAVTGGRPAAGRLARANDASLVGFLRDGTDVVVTVDLDGVRARARATNAP